MIEKHDVIYARVSSHEQKQKGDLDRQALFLIENVKDLHNPIIMKEVGSGLHDKRKTYGVDVDSNSCKRYFRNSRILSE